jgi:serine/threonine protein kinase
MVCELLHTGAYGVVHLVIERVTGRDFACKVLPKQRGKVAPEKLARKIRTEVELLCRVQVSLFTAWDPVCCR